MENNYFVELKENELEEVNGGAIPWSVLIAGGGLLVNVGENGYKLVKENWTNQGYNDGFAYGMTH